ncbi:MAG: hypothetical protein E6J22_02985 [Chloroflexi bacterium]|nr:MAG: hypothetical protein E6J22_02985 [Chloroflexota bacterium]
MQTLSEQRQTNNLSSQSRTIAIFAMLLFAFAGLISGFAVGTFTRPGSHPQTTNTIAGSTPPITSRNMTPTPTPHLEHPIPLGFPKIDIASDIVAADDTHTYTISVQVTDQSNGKAVGNPVHASGITCKIWLTKDGNVNKNMPTDRLKATDTLSSPFPKEESGSLDFFDTTTPQTQMCNPKGRATWHYKVASSTAPGTYFLVALTDWGGIHYDWSWVQINVMKSQ